MKMNLHFSVGRGWVVFFLLVCGLAGSIIPAAAAEPTITSVALNGTNLLITVDVPQDVAKVTLESRSRFGEGTWMPRAVSRQTGQLTFTLALSSATEMLRVRTDATEALPSYFYRGTNNFNGALAGSTTYMDKGTVPYNLGGDAVAAPTDSTSGTTRSVVESDIWRIDGETLYYFNQMRGLQVIDLHNPQSPVLRGALYLPAVGEQMYLVDGQTVALLARKNNNWNNGQPESQVLLVNVANGQPVVITNLPVWGSINESRLVGSALYVASWTYRAQTNEASVIWEYGTQVTSFDLANPSAAKVTGTLWYPGYQNVVMATPEYFFVVTRDTADWNLSLVNCIDISAPDGTMQALSTIVTAGTVNDKFKLNVGQDTHGVNFLSLITASWMSNRWATVLENYSLANPRNPQRLCHWVLEKAGGEQLHATRFDGNRVYIVTFFRVDPLWVVDLADPSNPKVTGALEVPGWSNYIEPLGDRLVTVGIDNTNGWRVSVSLFNVQNPANPSLISRVPLGSDLSSSWSEANYDEKAFTVLPAAELILVPYQGHATNGFASRVQLIDLHLDDLTTNGLALRGVIDHQFQPRRATIYGSTILSISGRELLSVDASDRDHPRLNSILELAWPVNTIFVRGDYVIEIENGGSGSWWWTWTGGQTALRVAPATEPDKILSRLVLTNNLSATGVTLRDGYLYVAQSQYQYYGYYPMLAAADSGQPEPANFCLNVIDVTHLPTLILASQSALNLTNMAGGSMKAVWPKPDVLVWSAGGGGYYPWLWMGGIDVMPTKIGGVVSSIYWPGWGGTSGHLLAFDVQDKEAPRLASVVDLTTNTWWSFSQPISVDNLVYLSHQGYEFTVVAPASGDTVVKTPVNSSYYVTNNDQVGYWLQKYYLDVVDYADPNHPVARPPVNIPGLLKGVAVNGAVLFTQGYHWNNAGTTDYREWLDASAYDGVSAAQIDTLALPATWPHPLLTVETNVLFGNPANSTNKMNLLEIWQLSDTGRFVQRKAQVMDTATTDLALLGELLVAQQNYYSYLLLDAHNWLNLQPLGQARLDGYLWGNLGSADGAVDRGLWLPLGEYGAYLIPVKK